MNPSEIKSSLLGACKFVPQFLTQNQELLIDEAKREELQRYATTFRQSHKQQKVFIDDGPHSRVLITLLEALLGSAPLSAELGNPALSQMLSGTHATVTGFSAIKQLDVLSSEGITEAETLAKRYQSLVKSKDSPFKKKRSTAAARFTADVVTLLEQQSDEYSKALADHLLSAFANRD